MANPWNEDEPFDYSGTWLGCRTAQRHTNRKVSGDPEVDWFAHALRRVELDDPACRCLMLGASEGHRVRQLCEAGFAGEVVATDIADRALARARRDLAGFKNVRFEHADLNEHRFDGRFDVIVAEGVLHHIANLEPLLRHLRDLLEPSGLLVAVEFEGPFRFQLGERQLLWINAALAPLPGGLRPLWEGDPGLPVDLAYQQRVYVVAPAEDAVRAADESEAVSGPQLRELLPTLFRVERRRGLGGSLLSYMGGHFPFQRADDDPEVDRFLRLLLAIEDAVIDAGHLDDDFVYYELRPR